MATVVPAQEQLRIQRLQISELIQYMGNGDQADALTTINAIVTALQTIQTAISSATNASITTL
jgi:hypothetical protein